MNDRWMVTLGPSLMLSPRATVTHFLLFLRAQRLGLGPSNRLLLVSRTEEPSQVKDMAPKSLDQSNSRWNLWIIILGYKDMNGP